MRITEAPTVKSFIYVFLNLLISMAVQIVLRASIFTNVIEGISIMITNSRPFVVHGIS